MIVHKETSGGWSPPKIYEASIEFCFAKQSEDDQAFTVLLERNRQAEVLKGLYVVGFRATRWIALKRGLGPVDTCLECSQ